MIRRAIRMTGVGLVAVATLGLTACDTRPVVLEGTLTHAETGAPLDPALGYSQLDVVLDCDDGEPALQPADQRRQPLHAVGAKPGSRLIQA